MSVYWQENYFLENYFLNQYWLGFGAEDAVEAVSTTRGGVVYEGEKRKKIRRKGKDSKASDSFTVPSYTPLGTESPLPSFSDLPQRLELLSLLEQLRAAIQAEEQAKVQKQMEQLRLMGEHQARLEIEDLLHQMEFEQSILEREALIEELITQTEDEILLGLAI